jgi:flavodoxin I
MKALIVYDSVYGSTEAVARAVGNAIGVEARALRASEASLSDLQGIDFLIVGSPTQGGRPTPAIQEFLDKLSPNSLKVIKTVAFDTRISSKLVGIFGYAAGRIAGALKNKGSTLIVPPKGFFAGSKGPLKAGEPEWAAAWAQEILKVKI